MRTASVMTGLMVMAIIGFLIFENSQAEEPAQIGVLVTESSRMEKLTGIEDGLADLGFADDDVVFHVYEEEDPGLLLSVATDLVHADYDLITAFGGIETQVLQEAMDGTESHTPVVFVGMAAPMETGIIERFEAPGGQFTGIANHHLSLSAKRVELFTDALPELEAVVLLYNASIDISERSLAMALEAADELQINALAFDVGDVFDAEALNGVLGPNTGLMTLPSFVIEGMTGELAEFAMAKDVPLMGIYDDEASAGFLMSYGSSFYDQGYQAARQVSMLLSGNDPENLPVELPDQLLFHVNDDVARELGVTLNEDILRLAEPVPSEQGGVLDAQ
ncbi:ABC transporter substrate-binding protein [Salisediminibacterium beveridgei]|uniref:ABC transporter substrate-binding protein n=1 Tax=Salisediminibacterium beveridgei TaxID=632773 RepID=A0A1D7QYM9_9BACI|nr:ABC transporter substrate-binding protein [Salisediminibacterium beveridgei]AOM84111.1 ABC transporter substrate-binding protein [Salisediminibacterium beveridgei]